MKTKKCRPVLVESKENTGITLGVNITRNIPGIMRGQNYQLILISLGPDEKIEVGDKVYEKNLNTETSIYEVYERNGKLGFFRFRSVFIPFDKQNSAKKVIATQSQLSPEYIQQFIEEYNEGEVKDVEIEMVTMNKGYNNHEDSPYNEIDIPKLTNGFVTIIAKNNVVNFNCKVDEDTFTIYGAGKFQEEELILDKTKASLLFVELWKFLKFDKPKEPKLYTEEEVKQKFICLLKDMKFRDDFSENFVIDWFEQNKKK